MSTSHVTVCWRNEEHSFPLSPLCSFLELHRLAAAHFQAPVQLTHLHDADGMSFPDGEMVAGWVDLLPDGRLYLLESADAAEVEAEAEEATQFSALSATPAPATASSRHTAVSAAPLTVPNMRPNTHADRNKNQSIPLAFSPAPVAAAARQARRGPSSSPPPSGGQQLVLRAPQPSSSNGAASKGRASNRAGIPRHPSASPSASSVPLRPALDPSIEAALWRCFSFYSLMAPQAHPDALSQQLFYRLLCDAGVATKVVDRTAAAGGRKATTPTDSLPTRTKRHAPPPPGTPLRRPEVELIYINALKIPTGPVGTPTSPPVSPPLAPSPSPPRSSSFSLRSGEAATPHHSKLTFDQFLHSLLYVALTFYGEELPPTHASSHKTFSFWSAAARWHVDNHAALVRQLVVEQILPKVEGWEEGEVGRGVRALEADRAAADEENSQPGAGQLVSLMRSFEPSLRSLFRVYANATDLHFFPSQQRAQQPKQRKRSPSRSPPATEVAEVYLTWRQWMSFTTDFKFTKLQLTVQDQSRIFVQAAYPKCIRCLPPVDEDAAAAPSATLADPHVGGGFYLNPLGRLRMDFSQFLSSLVHCALVGLGKMRMGTEQGVAHIWQVKALLAHMQSSIPTSPSITSHSSSGSGSSSSSLAPTKGGLPSSTLSHSLSRGGTGGTLQASWLKAITRFRERYFTMWKEDAHINFFDRGAIQAMAEARGMDCTACEDTSLARSSLPQSAEEWSEQLDQDEAFHLITRSLVAQQDPERAVGVAEEGLQQQLARLKPQQQRASPTAPLLLTAESTPAAAASSSSSSYTSASSSRSARSSGHRSPALVPASEKSPLDALLIFPRRKRDTLEALMPLPPADEDLQVKRERNSLAAWDQREEAKRREHARSLRQKARQEKEQAAARAERLNSVRATPRVDAIWQSLSAADATDPAAADPAQLLASFQSQAKRKAIEPPPSVLLTDSTMLGSPRSARAATAVASLPAASPPPALPPASSTSHPASPAVAAPRTLSLLPASPPPASPSSRRRRKDASPTPHSRATSRSHHHSVSPSPASRSTSVARPKTPMSASRASRSRVSQQAEEDDFDQLFEEQQEEEEEGEEEDGYQEEEQQAEQEGHEEEQELYEEQEEGEEESVIEEKGQVEEEEAVQEAEAAPLPLYESQEEDRLSQSDAADEDDLDLGFDHSRSLSRAHQAEDNPAGEPVDLIPPSPVAPQTDADEEAEAEADAEADAAATAEEEQYEGDWWASSPLEESQPASPLPLDDAAAEQTPTAVSRRRSTSSRRKDAEPAPDAEESITEEFGEASFPDMSEVEAASAAAAAAAATVNPPSQPASPALASQKFARSRLLAVGGQALPPLTAAPAQAEPSELAPTVAASAEPPTPFDENSDDELDLFDDEPQQQKQQQQQAQPPLSPAAAEAASSDYSEDWPDASMDQINEEQGHMESEEDVAQRLAEEERLRQEEEEQQRREAEEEQQRRQAEEEQRQLARQQQVAAEKAKAAAEAEAREQERVRQEQLQAEQRAQAEAERLEQEQQQQQEKLLATVTAGDYFTKLTPGVFGVKKGRKFVRVSSHGNKLFWGDNANALDKSIVLAELTSVRAGTGGAKAFAKLTSDQALCAFSLETATRSLALLAPSAEVRATWIQFLKPFVQSAASEEEAPRTSLTSAPL